MELEYLDWFDAGRYTLSDLLKQIKLLQKKYRGRNIEIEFDAGANNICAIVHEVSELSPSLRNCR